MIDGPFSAVRSRQALIHTPQSQLNPAPVTLRLLPPVAGKKAPEMPRDLRTYFWAWWPSGYKTQALESE